jgi:hypothetical protein
MLLAIIILFFADAYANARFIIMAENNFWGFFFGSRNCCGPSTTTMIMLALPTVDFDMPFIILWKILPSQAIILLMAQLKLLQHAWN